MPRTIILVLACACFLVVLSGCCSNPMPDMRVSWPVNFEKQQQTVAGPRLIQGPPTYYAPSYQPVASPSAYAAPCVPAAMQAAPCP